MGTKRIRAGKVGLTAGGGAINQWQKKPWGRPRGRLKETMAEKKTVELQKKRSNAPVFANRTVVW